MGETFSLAREAEEARAQDEPFAAVKETLSWCGLQSAMWSLHLLFGRQPQVPNSASFGHVSVQHRRERYTLIGGTCGRLEKLHVPACTAGKNLRFSNLAGLQHGALRELS
eukprot:1443015-Amphidinium_carterae.2